MSPEERFPEEGKAFFKSTEEILSEGDPARRGNPISADLIGTQPLPAAGPQTHHSQDGFKEPQHDFQKPTCPQCGLTIPDHRLLPVPLSPVRLQNSKSRTSSSQSGDRSNRSGPGSPRTTEAPKGSCFQLLLACLWCQCSVLLLGLLEACSCCLQGLCSACCCCCCCRRRRACARCRRACARCRAELQDVPAEELGCRTQCHQVLFEACCEPTECLEFCLECCEICHRS